MMSQSKGIDEPRLKPVVGNLKKKQFVIWQTFFILDFFAIV